MLQDPHALITPFSLTGVKRSDSIGSRSQAFSMSRSSFSMSKSLSADQCWQAVSARKNKQTWTNKQKETKKKHKNKSCWQAHNARFCRPWENNLPILKSFLGKINLWGQGHWEVSLQGQDDGKFCLRGTGGGGMSSVGTGGKGCGEQDRWETCSWRWHSLKRHRGKDHNAKLLYLYNFARLSKRLEERVGRVLVFPGIYCTRRSVRLYLQLSSLPERQWQSSTTFRRHPQLTFLSYFNSFDVQQE